MGTPPMRPGGRPPPRGATPADRQSRIRGVRMGMRRWSVAVSVSLSVALGGASGAALAAEAPKHVIQDPHYGDTLFYFYQDRYFTSIPGLMTSQHFTRVAQHADEAEVLRDA